MHNTNTVTSALCAADSMIDFLRKSGQPIVNITKLPAGDIDLEVRPCDLLAVAHFLRDENQLDFKYFNFMFGTDKVDYLETVYIVNSLICNVRLQLRTRIDPNEPKIDSVTAVWRGANWHERETLDMLGISFTGHPYHQRMFLDEDFEGHPLRRSFKLAGRAD